MISQLWVTIHWRSAAWSNKITALDPDVRMTNINIYEQSIFLFTIWPKMYRRKTKDQSCTSKVKTAIPRHMTAHLAAEYTLARVSSRKSDGVWYSSTQSRGCNTRRWRWWCKKIILRNGIEFTITYLKS